MANADGGLLLFGVEDSGAVVGVPEEQALQVRRRITGIATNDCSPAIRPTIRTESVPDDGGVERCVLVAEIPPGLFVHRTEGGHCYT